MKWGDILVIYQDIIKEAPYVLSASWKVDSELGIYPGHALLRHQHRPSLDLLEPLGRKID